MADLLSVNALELYLRVHVLACLISGRNEKV